LRSQKALYQTVT